MVCIVYVSFLILFLTRATDFGEAERQFQRILAIDPYRIDNIDIYSDILYVTDNRIKLSKLAHDYLELDKDRPEICCLVGKFYLYSSHNMQKSNPHNYFRESLFITLRT
jgi:hypothetical protein